jgi:hypothetical protein
MSALLLLVVLAASGQDTGGCDLDGDGFDGLYCGGDDCNDDDAAVFPGAEEVPADGLDQDCDGYDEAAGAQWVGSGGSALCGTTVPSSLWLVAVAGLLIGRRRCWRS